MKRICIPILVLAALAAAAPAQAAVYVEGSGEPQFTNSASNTQWIRWEKPQGIPYYRLEIKMYENGVSRSVETVSVGPASGTTAVSWSGFGTLAEGNTYRICVQGQGRWTNEGDYFQDGPSSCASGTAQGKRTETTIDRTPPTATLAAAGGAEVTKGPSIPLAIGFEDNLAGAQPANFLCVKPHEAGTAASQNCSSGFVFSPACSVGPAAAKSATFGCNLEPQALPDGPVDICVIATDGAGPDNPTGSSQSFSQTSTNKSEAACDTVTLDRVSPSLSVTASTASALVGETVSFGSQAADATSGIDSASARWEFGDGGEAAGASSTHAFTQAGTFTVRHRVRDAAGNEATKEVVVTVAAPATKPAEPETKPDDPRDNPPVPAPSPTPSPTPSPVPTDISDQEISKAAGGEPVARTQVGNLTVIAPKRVRLGTTKRLVVGAATDQAGQLTLTLVRGKKVHARVTAALQPGSKKLTLKLSKKAKAGGYSLKIAFTPAGASWSASGSAKVALLAARRKG